MKTIACSVSSCVLNYDKIACEISIVYDAEKHQLLDTELDDLSVVKWEIVFRLLNYLTARMNAEDIIWAIEMNGLSYFEVTGWYTTIYSILNS